MVFNSEEINPKACILSIYIWLLFFSFLDRSASVMPVSAVVLLSIFIFTRFNFSIYIFKFNVFMYVFSFMLFVALIVRIYSISFLGELHTTHDALAFYGLMDAESFAFSELEIRRIIGSPFAIRIWQKMYSVAYWFGFDKSISVGIVVNSFTMAISISILERVSSRVSEIQGGFVNHTLKCSLLYVFSALFLRDAFLFLSVSLFIWGFHLWFFDKTIKNILLYCLCGAVSISCASLLRFESSVILLLFFLSSFFLHYQVGRITVERVVVIVLLNILGAVVFFTLGAHEEILKISSGRNDIYEGISASTAAEGSLGAKILLGQPVFIKIFMGSMFVMVPIPIWGNLYLWSPEIYILLFLNSIFFIVTFPVFISGMLEDRKRVVKGAQWQFRMICGVAFLIGLGMVGVTSIEIRHLGQFLPFLFICSHQYLRRQGENSSTIIIFKSWIALVVSLHFMWAILKIVFS